jgi:hypothetical protein
MDKKKTNFHLGEDWWAVIVAFLLILLAALGLLGENGLSIPF